ncbi:lymphocyte antigen 6E [Pantherophis guttatus]|uniref:Lymphocyte antigen 6E-like n=1 Tax=Pantherophis guttatus TaxID=94885 RepID=A0A098LX08_PANGU|nr:lymphocyte antigen 6E [Pantherophis guttatus]
MKTLLVAFLVAIVCTEKVHSLSCYYCENEPSNWNCISMKKCAETDKYCTTVKTVSRGRLGEPDDYRISKRCTPTCDESYMTTGLSSTTTNCCQFTFCNFSGAASVKLSNMVLVLGILGSFFYIFQSR